MVGTFAYSIILKKFQKGRLYNQLEQNKLIDTLDNLGLMLDIKTINEL